MKRKAFTLIELLVVIAIIAILAAILFPVFAQAKQAAKVTVLLSNTKEIGLAALMYTNDNDDAMPLAVDGTDITNQGNWTWQFRLQPYVKNWGVFYSPLYPQPTGPQAYWEQIQYFGGMPTPQASNQTANYVNTDPYTHNATQYQGILGSGLQMYGSNPNGAPSITTTQPDHPADTAMFTPAGQWDYWATVYGTANPLGMCASWGAGWSPYGTEWVFGGPISSKPMNYSGIGTGCNFPDGKVLYVGMDGSAHTTDYWGGLFHSTQLSDGTWVYDKYWMGGLN